MEKNQFRQQIQQKKQLQDRQQESGPLILTQKAEWDELTDDNGTTFFFNTKDKTFHIEKPNQQEIVPKMKFAVTNVEDAPIIERDVTFQNVIKPFSRKLRTTGEPTPLDNSELKQKKTIDNENDEEIYPEDDEDWELILLDNGVYFFHEKTLNHSFWKNPDAEVEEKLLHKLMVLKAMRRARIENAEVLKMKVLLEQGEEVLRPKAKDKETAQTEKEAQKLFIEQESFEQKCEKDMMGLLLDKKVAPFSSYEAALSLLQNEERFLKIPDARRKLLFYSVIRHPSYQILLFSR